MAVKLWKWGGWSVRSTDCVGFALRDLESTGCINIAWPSEPIFSARRSDRFLSFPFRLNFASRHCKRFLEPSQQPYILCRYVWPIRFITGPISALSRHFCFTRVMSFYSVLAKKVMYTYITVMPLAHSLIVSILQRTIEWSMSAYCIAEGARRLIWWSRGRLEQLESTNYSHNSVQAHVHYAGDFQLPKSDIS